MKKNSEIGIFTNSHETTLDDAISKIKHGICKNLEIDFSHLSFLDCEDTVRFKCLIHLAQENSIPLKLTEPKNSDVKNYGLRVGLFDDTNIHKIISHREAPRLIPLKLIKDDANDYLLEDLNRVFSPLGPSVNWAPALFESLSELANNVYFHAGPSDNSGWGFLQAQQYPQKSEVCVSLCDVGIGLLESYRRRGMVNNRSEAELIMESFKELVSSRNTPDVLAHRGKGLFEVLNFVRSFQAKLEFSTGSYMASVSPENSEIHIKPRSHLEGTLIKLEVPIQ